MCIISKTPFEECVRKYPNDALALHSSYRVIKEMDFSTPEEMRMTLPNLDSFKYRNKWHVLDVGGNNFRVIAYINFANKQFFVKYITNRVEYDKLTRYYREDRERLLILHALLEQQESWLMQFPFQETVAQEMTIVRYWSWSNI